jgi:REP element-mobilizing transposase RayT
MARPLRIDFDDALYHVIARGDRREPFYEGDDDRQLFLCTLAVVIRQRNWLCHVYGLMTHHYHLLIETPDGNLSKGIACFTLAFLAERSGLAGVTGGASKPCRR